MKFKTERIKTIKVLYLLIISKFIAFTNANMQPIHIPSTRVNV
jgi:hypothetical protein